VGNRLYREDIAAASNSKNFDELYAYDGMNQLVDMQRGKLNVNKNGIASGKNYLEELLKSDHRKKMTVEDFEALQGEVSAARQSGYEKGWPRLRGYLDKALSVGGNLASILGLGLTILPK